MKTYYFNIEIQKKILGRGHSPPQTSPQWGGGHPLPLLTHIGALIIAPLALDLWPHQTEILATPLSLSVCTVSD